MIGGQALQGSDRSPEQTTPWAPKIQPVPTWAKDWFNEKLAASLSKCTLANYVWAIKILNIDLSKSTIAEIRSRLAECSTHYTRSSLRLLTITAKQILKAFDREKEATNLKLPKPSEPRIVVYSQEEINRMLRVAARSLRDRLLIGILAETGARRGELYNMRIKDVGFDRYSGIIWLHGKTGTRQRRVYRSKGDLLRYLKQHPDKSNPEAWFWVDHQGRRLSNYWCYRRVTRIGQRALNRHVYPHQLRHSAATQDARQFTDRELMLRFGWNSPAMVSIYTHLNPQDLDEKDLALHNLKDTPRGSPCSGCLAENTPTAKYCQNCGQPLFRQVMEQGEIFRR